MSFSMGVAEREAFLAEARVGVLSVAQEDGVATLAVPMWYAYAPGQEVVIHTHRESRKADLIRATGRFGICVHEDGPTFRYVGVEGPVTSEGPVSAEAREAMAHRYLPPELARAYLEASAEQQAGLGTAFRMRPARWRAADHSALAAKVAGAM
ncbi:pyridoxamine 5'-phosphate oxidase family protein [Streptomyces sp. SP18CS02]|uniref:pyridoxamine 5'-phosphate oxidase family protein n=1 Tax=Streptomyces sp. SP18CS02 TaxID=3002531 RepID=UPI002E78EA79|nr:pyridoxamine 5'-phosphate oxidase family protein [Streptomyces sp. SP18CS02]MEE1754752.1 pyridoxamine 5'-phosphate oxidase family protein [Streptomyces sp. SP18CS02]